MKHLKRYNEVRSFTKEDHHNLDELVADIKNIMLDVIDEYQLMDVTPSNAEYFDVDGDDLDFDLTDNKNSYVIYSEVKHSRHGSYGVVIIKINCTELYNEQAPSLKLNNMHLNNFRVSPDGLFKELLLRLNTIGSSYAGIEEDFIDSSSMRIPGEVDILRIQVTPKN